MRRTITHTPNLEDQCAETLALLHALDTALLAVPAMNKNTPQADAAWAVLEAAKRELGAAHA